MMEIKKKLKMDILEKQNVQVVYTVQNDANTRGVELNLFSGGFPWVVPDGVSISVAYRKPDKTSGWYDKLPDGSDAYSVDGNAVTITFAPQVMTVPGTVKASVVFQDSETLDRIATFPMEIYVEEDPAAGKSLSNNYYKYKTLEDINTAIDSTKAYYIYIEEDGDGNLVADKTFNDIRTHYYNGASLYAKYNRIVLPLHGEYSSDRSYVFEGTVNDNEHYRFTVYGDQSVDGVRTVLATTSALQNTSNELNMQLENLARTVDEVAEDAKVVQVNLTATEEEGVYTADRSYEEVVAAIDAGRTVIVVHDGIYHNYLLEDSGDITFTANIADYMSVVYISPDIVVADIYPFAMADQIPTKVSQLENDIGFVTSVPTELKNPHKLIFTGAVSAEYDGSSAVTVEIPVGGEGTETETILSDNLFDKSIAVTGKVFYHGSSGPTISDSKDCFYAYVPLNGAGTYHTKISVASHGEAYAKRVPILKADNSFLQNVTGTITATEVDTAYDLKFTITEDMIASGAAVYAFDGVTKHLNELMIVKDRAYPSTYIPYGYIEVEVGGAKASNVLSGKTAVFLGDSICAGTTVLADAKEYGYGWGGLIGEANKMLWKNYGRNGGTVTPLAGVDQVRWIPYQADLAIAAYPNADYVIFDGGANDGFQLGADGMGAFSESGYAPASDADFTGAFETLVLKLLNAYPTARVGYIVPPKISPSEDYSATSNVLRQYFDRAVEICKKWGVPVLDLWNGNPLNPKLSVYYDSSLTADEANTNGKCYTDGQHLTLTGYERITPQIEAWMRSL